MIDSHCHIQFRGYNKDREEVLQRCRDKECKMITIGTQKDTSRLAVEYATNNSDIFAVIGLHPIHLFSTHVDEEESSFISREEEFDYEYYKNLAQNPKTVGIGECGIELFHLPKELNKTEILKKQQDLFAQQIKLANELDLPVVIHIRDAHKETIDFLNTLDKKPKAVVHCYTSDWSDAQKYLEMGFYLGFTGIITFPPKKTDPKPQQELLEVVQNCPLDRMLIETDSPYLAPQAYRGKKCEPWMVEEVAKKIGEIRNLSFTKVVEITENNTKKLFTKIAN